MLIGNKNMFWRGGATPTVLTDYYLSLRLNANSNDDVGTNNGIDTAITYGTGIVNGCAEFNDSTSNIIIPDSDNTSFEDRDFSISFLVKFNSIKDCYFIDKRESLSVGREFQIRHNIGTDLAVRLFNYNSSSRLDIVYPWIPATDTWYHIIITKGVDLKAYINGVFVDSAFETGTYVKMGNFTGTTIIGAFKGETIRTLDGCLDEIKYWDKKLSKSECLELATNELNGIEV